MRRTGTNRASHADEYAALGRRKGWLSEAVPGFERGVGEAYCGAERDKQIGDFFEHVAAIARAVLSSTLSLLRGVYLGYITLRMVFRSCVPDLQASGQESLLGVCLFNRRCQGRFTCEVRFCNSGVNQCRSTLSHGHT